jgi:hypothetical protein
MEENKMDNLRKPNPNFKKTKLSALKFKLKMLPSFKELTKTAVGVILILLGIAAGLYMGVYVCFYGGILSVVTGIQAITIGGIAAETAAASIALGFVKIIFASFVGVVTFLICAAISSFFL